MEVQKLKVEKTGHYYRHNTPGPHIKQLWLVCHGYAQPADEFMAELTPLLQDDFLVLAPEGAHNFYKKGFYGEVKTSWMTSRNREDEIEDFSTFLQVLFEKYRTQVPDNVQVVFLGFSQGCATVCRWILRKFPEFDALMLWGGLPPDDLDYQAHKTYLGTKSLYLLYGSRDPFLTEDRITELRNLEEKHQIDFDERAFEGGHEVPPSALLDFLEKLKSNLNQKNPPKDKPDEQTNNPFAS